MSDFEPFFGRRKTAEGKRCPSNNNRSSTFNSRPFGHDLFGFMDPFLNSGSSFSANPHGEWLMGSGKLMGSAGKTPKKTSMSTKYAGGKKITTKKVISNGVTTITVLENDKIKSRSVNGVPQLVI